MCDSMKILDELRPRQIKPKTVKCTASSTCWCMQVSHKFGHDRNIGGCMSPAEMLDAAGNVMNAHDIKYLKQLSKYEFDPNEP